MTFKSGIIGLVSRKDKSVPIQLDMKQIHVHFTGQVQKVGFRRTAQLFATELAIKGWVRNLADGRVELVAEGKTSDLSALMNRLNGRFQIIGVEMRESAANGAFPDFAILP